MSNPCSSISKVYCHDVFWDTEVYRKTASGIIHHKTLSLVDEMGQIIWKRVRNFSLEGSETTDKADAYWLYRKGADGASFCADVTVLNFASVNEDYHTEDSALLFLDLRTRTALYRHVTNRLTFGCASTDMAAFRGPWGNSYFHKLKITSAPKTKTVSYVLLRDGVREVLKSETYNTNLYSEKAPLILLYPNPPSNMEPIDAEVKEHGFYDYHGDSWDGLAKSDGGKDYYYPEWCRGMGEDVSRDCRLRDDRFTMLLTLVKDREAHELGEGAPYPGYQFPAGNCARDKLGNVLYSFLVDSTGYNKLFTVDGAQLDVTNIIFKEGAGTTALFPVAPV